jgi:hypothetical protein
MQLFFPPPPSCTNIFTRFNCPGAWFTANAGKSTVMQEVIGDIILPDILPNLFFGPVNQGIDLYKSVVGIPLHQLVKEPGY